MSKRIDSIDPLDRRFDDLLPSGGPRAKTARLLSLLGNIKSRFDDFIENAVKDLDRAGFGPDQQDLEAAARYLLELGLTADAKRLMAMRDNWVKNFTDMGIAEWARNMSPEERANLTEMADPFPAPEEDPKAHARLQDIRRDAIVGSADKFSKFLGGLIDHVEAVVGKEKAAGDGQAEDGKPLASEPEGPISARALAKRYDLRPEPLRKRLDRRRKEDSTCFIETADREAREPRYLYHFDKVKDIITDLGASVGASVERPSPEKSA